MTERVELIYEALKELGFSEEEIISKINMKLLEYQGFMTKEGALYLVGKENGINVYSSAPNIQNDIEELIDYNDFAINLSSVIEGMQNIVITGRIKEIFRIKKFTKKDNTSGFVGSFQICDKSDCIKIVLWNEQVKIMENEYFKKEEIVQVIGGYSKKGINNNLEVHLSKKGKIILAPDGVILPEIIDQNKPKNKNDKKIKKFSSSKIEDLHEKEGFIRYVKGIVHIDELRELTLKNGEKSFLLKLILNDNSDSIRINIWGLKAIECIKLISNGVKVKIFNLFLKLNPYSNEKELNFTKSSRLELI